AYPDMNEIKSAVGKVAARSWFLPCRDCGLRAGSVQSGNTALLGAVCASGLLPFGVDALREGIRKFLPTKLVEVNLAALENGIQYIS
ncbi:MAG: 2-oxoacid:acceptor oxidoreductase family protein, partial [Desulfovibrionaceae bacterium]|nr:2-oxoacid:acceptor oxidoreductase family protein [Desulfovibrionaceae bacterium]